MHMQQSYRFLKQETLAAPMKSAAESQIHAHAIQLQENNGAVIQGTTKPYAAAGAIAWQYCSVFGWSECCGFIHLSPQNQAGAVLSQTLA